MIIGIDGNEANVDKKVGIGEYAYELLLNFYKIASKREDLNFLIYLKEPPRSDMPVPATFWRYKVIGPKKLWTRFALPLGLFLETKKPDVFFSPSHYGPGFSPIPSAISIMDLSFIYFPQLFAKKDLYQLTNWTRNSAARARKIFTISKFSKDDIIKTYSKDSQDVIVTYPGIKPDLRFKNKDMSMDDLNKKFGIKRDYILFVGTLQPRKNIERLIEAFSKLNPEKLKLKDSLQLVIVGKRGWLYEDILKAPEKYNVQDNVKFLDFVEDNDLPSLYKNALCFVLPSLYEGFGLPVLEAMKNGCPVVTSNVSSLPEVGGDAALYVNPEDCSDIAEKIEKIISNQNLRNDLIKKGYEQVKKFSWEKTASKTLDVLQELGGKN